MVQQNYDYCLDRILAYEGGYVDHPKDPGGATNLGITIGTLSRWLGRQATKKEVRALTVAAVKPIYHAYYWGPVRGDLMPSGVDLALFDYGVNSGTGRAVRHFQEILGVTVDGAIGAETMGAVAAQHPEFMVRALCDRRMQFLLGLSTFSIFGTGWSRRVEDVEDRGLTLATDEPHFSAALAEREARARRKSK
jgi:lysozyme family protein